MAFNKFDAEAIYRIPLSRWCVPDKLFWLHNKNGRYLVKSDYHTARYLWNELKQDGEGSNPKPGSEIWARIWHACHNILPTLERLRQRRIIENALCPICMQAPETIVHALWECGAAQDVWAGYPQRALQKGLNAQASILQLVEELMQRLSEDALEAFLVQCWLLWHRRNRVVHGGLLQEPGVLIDQAKSLLAEYKNAQVLLTIPALAGPCLGWQPPDGSTYKLNFDAAVFSNASASGVGVMIRNAGGQVMAALSSRGLAVLDSDEAEVLACRRALEFAVEVGFSDLIVEGDNANVMRSIVST
ncbi:uncharacterized protein LOC115991023 [Quercus lobata]|uniref:uncharacterized protein LOC115991023 n=1 Tax=Quercus lobata TaxID=97700 RepID=UPI00124862AA|nr:uncharacterized protein LOC115991023 [Quercus lobata]